MNKEVAIDIDSSEPHPDSSCQVGSRSELASLYEAEHARLVRLAHLLTGTHAVAEEVVQDAFVRLQGKWDQARNPAAYVRQIVVNEARGRMRRQAVERRHLPPPVPPVLPPEVDEMWLLLKGLSPRRRVALVLRYYADLPVLDIAKLMGCRPATVKSLIHRGLETLRRKLDDNDT